jgi:tRNA(His) 5'-end guanylyltransferase
MKFDELDKKMRIFETAHDYCALPGMYLVARLDGRSFTKWTKDGGYETPFDDKIKLLMVETTKHLMDCGFNIKYGYTESDEISLLFNLDETTFSRKLRKLNSVLAGEASAKIALLTGKQLAFDCRISQLPSINYVVDYFRWRNEDANRNCLSSHCYWMLRKAGQSARSASSLLNGKGNAAKNELLFQNGINYNDVPNWQKRGVGIYWNHYLKTGLNPLTNEKVLCERKNLFVEYNLPKKDSYSFFIKKLIMGFAS